MLLSENRDLRHCYLPSLAHSFLSLLFQEGFFAGWKSGAGLIAKVCVTSGFAFRASVARVGHPAIQPSAERRLKAHETALIQTT